MKGKVGLWNVQNFGDFSGDQTSRRVFDEQSENGKPDFGSQGFKNDDG